MPPLRGGFAKRANLYQTHARGSDRESSPGGQSARRDTSRSAQLRQRNVEHHVARGLGCKLIINVHVFAIDLSEVQADAFRRTIAAAGKAVARDQRIGQHIFLKGNMHAISKPKLNLPANLSIYGDPEIKEDIDYTEDGVEGDKTYKFFLKVVSGGSTTLNPLTLSY